MSKIHDYTSRVDIVSTYPLIASFTFEADYSKSVIRISFDAEIGKYWVQHKGNRFHRALILSDIYASLPEIGTRRIAASIYYEVSRDFAEGLSAAGIDVTGIDDDFWVTAPGSRMTREDLRAFACHVIREFDTRYVPSLEEIEREVVAGLREIAAAAARVGEAA